VLHRHLTHQRHTLAALDDLVANGTLSDWRPVLRRVLAEPDGDVATRLRRVVADGRHEERGAFWLAFLDHAQVSRKRPLPSRIQSGVDLDKNAALLDLMDGLDG